MYTLSKSSIDSWKIKNYNKTERHTVVIDKTVPHMGTQRF